MTPDIPSHALQLRSLVTRDGKLELSLAEVPVATPAENEVVVRIQASPFSNTSRRIFLAVAAASL